MSNLRDFWSNREKVLWVRGWSQDTVTAVHADRTSGVDKTDLVFALETTQRALEEFERAGILPNAVVASAEGGVGIVFVRSARYADVEFLNDGDILMSTYCGEKAPVVRELPSAADVVGVIQRYISA